MHIPTFKIPIIREKWELNEQGDHAFSIDLKDAYLYVPFVQDHCCFYGLFGASKHISGKF